MDQPTPDTPPGANPGDPSRRMLHDLRGRANAIYLNAAALAQSLDQPNCWEFIDRLRQEVVELEALLERLGRRRADVARGAAAA
jgi:hypothetical protein